MLFVVRAVVLVGGSARGAAAGARTALAAGTELLADTACCNTHIAHIHTPVAIIYVCGGNMSLLVRYKKLDSP